MPTENSEVVQGKVFIKTNENDELKELGTIKEIAEVHNDDAVDALRYAVEGQKTTGTITMTISRESSKHLQKMLGIQKITRKRFIKLLMGCRIQRNNAQEIAKAINRSGVEYSPIAVQAVIEWLIKEVEKC